MSRVQPAAASVRRRMHALVALGAAAALAFAGGPVRAQATTFQCPALVASTARQPAYRPVPGQPRCEGFYVKNVSQPFVELVSLTQAAPGSWAAGSATGLTLRASRRRDTHLLIQPLRSSPLYRVDAPARGKKPASKMYALDEGELTATLDKLRKEGVREGAWNISRFKGLGEMSAEQLWETTLNPDTRRLLPVHLGASGVEGTSTLITKLMGKGEAAARRELMELHGDAVEIDI